MRIAIIGAGLAGTALGYILKQNGHDPVIYEASGTIAAGASGNEVGLYNPRFTAERGPEQEFYETAFFEACELFSRLPDINWNPCGALHLVTDEKKARRFPKTVQNWNWGEDKMRMVSAQEASTIAGVEITKDCLYLPQSGTLSPRKLCEAYVQGIEIHLNTPIDTLDDIKADIIILACGMGCLKFPQSAHLPLKAVRGQVTYVEETTLSSNLKCTLGYGGYIAPSLGGLHCVGSSFQPWLDHNKIIAQDDQDNLEKLFAAIPALQGTYTVKDHRAGVRTTSKTHTPIIEKLAPDLYVSTAHGSHGILSSLMGACILNSLI